MVIVGKRLNEVAQIFLLEYKKHSNLLNYWQIFSIFIFLYLITKRSFLIVKQPVFETYFSQRSLM